MDWLLIMDRVLFELVNTQLSSNILDSILPPMRDKFLWLPLYMIILAALLWKYQWRGAIILGFVLLTVFLTDQISASIIKPLVQRLRPCQNPEISVNLLVICGSGFSFVSSHASNHFGIAVFLGHRFRRFTLAYPLALLWATLICIAQVYVGVHYPLDIIGGALLGFLCAGVTLWGLSRLSGKFHWTW